jgi:hypothetical protein
VSIHIAVFSCMSDVRHENYRGKLRLLVLSSFREDLLMLLADDLIITDHLV